MALKVPESEDLRLVQKPFSRTKPRQIQYDRV